MSKQNEITELSVRTLSAEEFDGFESQWRTLLDRSDQNRVFMSWCWMHTWWRVFGQTGGAEPRILAAFDGNDRLVGVAPLFLETAGRLLKSTRRLQLLGSRWRAEDSTRTEYLSFVLDRDVAGAVADRMLQKIADMDDWDEFVVCNHDVATTFRDRIDAWTARNPYLVRELERGDTFQLKLDGDFSSYLASLSSKARLRMFNRRKRLQTHGDVAVDYPKSAEDIHAALQTLDAFHAARWKTPLLFGNRLRFHREVAVAMAERSLLDLSVLRVDDRPLSVLYDYATPSCKYGFQLAFDESLDKRLSPSQLHFGYAIEAAYERGLSTFDFLRGAGKSQKSYKDGISSSRTTTSTLQVVRNPRLRALYRLRDAMGGEPRVSQDGPGAGS